MQLPDQRQNGSRSDLTQEEEREQRRAEKNAWRDIADEKHRDVHQRHHEKQTVRDALKEAMLAIVRRQEPAENLEGHRNVWQERVKAREGHQANERQNSNRPPSSDRWVRPPQKREAEEREETRRAAGSSRASPPARGHA